MILLLVFLGSDIAFWAQRPALETVDRGPTSVAKILGLAAFLGIVEYVVVTTLARPGIEPYDIVANVFFVVIIMGGILLPRILMHLARIFFRKDL